MRPAFGSARPFQRLHPDEPCSAKRVKLCMDRAVCSVGMYGADMHKAVLREMYLWTLNLPLSGQLLAKPVDEFLLDTTHSNLSTDRQS